MSEYDQIMENIQDQIEYTAVLTYDGDVVGKVTCNSVESLQESLHKLEKAENKLVNKEYDKRIDDQAYMESFRADIIAEYNRGEL